MKSAISLRLQEPTRGPGTQSAPAPARFWYLSPLAWALLLALKAYQQLVPSRYKPECRFNPTCSHYMVLAIRKYGVLDGIRLGWKRFRSCVGFGPSGEDWP